MESLITHLYRPRTIRSPFSFWGDKVIVPFKTFFLECRYKSLFFSFKISISGYFFYRFRSKVVSDVFFG
uniref:Uncharacterized protein n=1 Tax=Solanum lycopersicum TaxID=4081 RepID=A0A3Q7JQM7_SOLLC